MIDLLMVQLNAVLQRIQREQDGLTMIEYGVMAAFLVLIVVGGVVLVGPQLRDWIVQTVDDIIHGG